MVSTIWNRLWLAYHRLYKIRKLIKYAMYIVCRSKKALKVGLAGCGIFKTSTVITIAMIASKNVSKRFVSIVNIYYFII
jgi:hypothetical protein